MNQNPIRDTCSEEKCKTNQSIDQWIKHKDWEVNVPQATVEEDSIAGSMVEKNCTWEKQLLPEISSICYTRTIGTTDHSETFGLYHLEILIMQLLQFILMTAHAAETLQCHLSPLWTGH